MKRLLPFLSVILLLSATACHSSKKVQQDTLYRPSKSVLSNKSSRSLIDEAYSWLGTPYLWAGETKKGADCSGFVMKVFDKALGIKLPRNSRAQSDFCSKINKSDLVPGDLVFFHTNSTGNVSHVGIYVGEGHIIHASASRGVTVACLDDRYFVEHFHHCGRVGEYASSALKLPPETIYDVAPVPAIPADAPVVLPADAHPAAAATVAAKPANPRVKKARHH